MASLFAELFEGGTAGTAVTTGNSNFDTVQADITFQTSPAPPQGTRWAKIAPASGVTRYMQVTVTATGVLYVRFYFRIDAAPTGAVDLLATRGSNGIRQRMGITTGRLATLQNGATNVWTSTTAIPAGDTHRAEIRIDNAAGQQQLRLFLGANRNGTTPDVDSGSRTYNQGSIDTLRFGQNNNTGLLVSYMDAVAVDNATWVGPVVAAPAALSASFTGTGTLTATVEPLSSSITATFTGTGTLTASIYGIPVPPPSVLRQFHEWVMQARGDAYAPTLTLPIISVRGVLRHMGVDSVVAVTTFTPDRWSALQPSYGLNLSRDGAQEFSGVVETRELDWDADTGRAVIKVECVGDEVNLDDRPVFPDPLRAADEQTVSDYWTYTGKASTAMLKLISDQAGPTARADRRVTGLALGTDPVAGTSRKWSGLFNNVLDQLTLMSVTSGEDLGLRMSSATGALTASVYVPRDLSDGVRFSADLSNLAGVNYRESAPTVTHALAAGQGDLKARLRKQATTSDPLALQWKRQIWEYIDRRDTSDVAELLEAAQDALADGGPTVSLAVTLLDSDAATYGVDWGLGDRITVYVGLPDQTKVATVSDVVREVAFEVFESGAESIRPAIGTFDAKAKIPTPTQRQLSTVGQKLGNLIRRK